MAVFFAGPLSAALFVVPQQQAYIIERFGKFLKVQFAGIHIRIPFVDRIAMKTNMRVNQLNVQLETKTLDNVFVTVVASTQFRVNPNDVATAYYELRDPAGQLRAYMEDALRSAIPALSLDDAFARKDDVAFDVQKTVGAEMSRFGFTVVKTLITAIDPSPQVKNAMDSINAALPPRNRQRYRRPDQESAGCGHEHQRREQRGAVQPVPRRDALAVRIEQHQDRGAARLHARRLSGSLRAGHQGHAHRFRDEVITPFANPHPSIVKPLQARGFTAFQL